LSQTSPATASAEADSKSSLTVEAQLRALETMCIIREFEMTVQRLFAEGLIRGTTHLGQGQEAVPVGVAETLREGDTMTCTYRGHGAVLAMGAPIDRCLAEMMGRADGICGGKGGSMHLTDVSVGAMGSFAIVGAHLPITLGLAFASRYRGGDSVSVCFFGDGSTNIGAFHESLNLASLWHLPIVFVCENNLYGEYSPLAATTPISRLADRGASYGMEALQVDGNDVGAVYAEVGAAVARARTGEGPTLVEALTYRQVGHSRTDPAKYRPEGELDKWLERDPILLLRKHLLESGINEEEVNQTVQRASDVVADALARVRSWPEPSADRVTEDVYASA
jgi:TPP-dependent pyruvate/acetoin dehydrogenase alpha subunit